MAYGGLLQKRELLILRELVIIKLYFSLKKEAIKLGHFILHKQHSSE